MDQIIMSRTDARLPQPAPTAIPASITTVSTGTTNFGENELTPPPNQFSTPTP